MPQARFEDINFRYSDAKTESEYAPELVQRAFVDVDGVSAQVLKPDRFIVSGQKGAGKTALAYRMRHVAQYSTDLVVAIEDLRSFQFNLLHYVDPPSERHAENTSAAWRCVLLLRVIALMSQVHANSASSPDTAELRRQLASGGYLHNEPLTELAERVREPDAYERIARLFRGPTIDATISHPASPTSIAALLETTLRQVPRIRSQILLFIDGLDDPMRFYENVRARRYMADLLEAVKDVNALLHSLRQRGKIVLLAREEILQDLPDPNLAKTLSDFGLPLRWHEDRRSLRSSDLLNVIAQRAVLAGWDISDGGLFSRWFANFPIGEDPLYWIARHTRFLPRDMIRFFSDLQCLRKEPPFDQLDLTRAARSYSDWFLEELLDSIKGLVREDIRLNIKEIVRGLRREFYVDELARELDARHLGDEKSAVSVARALFATGWISQVGSTPDGRRKLESSYRNRRATFDRVRKCSTHFGLLPTLGLV